MPWLNLDGVGAIFTPFLDVFTLCFYKYEFIASNDVLYLFINTSNSRFF
jgi:hypothetical protein